MPRPWERRWMGCLYFWYKRRLIERTRIIKDACMFGEKHAQGNVPRARDHGAGALARRVKAAAGLARRHHLAASAQRHGGSRGEASSDAEPTRAGARQLRCVATRYERCATILSGDITLAGICISWLDSCALSLERRQAPPPRCAFLNGGRVGHGALRAKGFGDGPAIHVTQATGAIGCRRGNGVAPAILAPPLEMNHRAVLPSHNGVGDIEQTALEHDKARDGTTRKPERHRRPQHLLPQDRWRRTSREHATAQSEANGEMSGSASPHGPRLARHRLTKRFTARHDDLRHIRAMDIFRPLPAREYQLAAASDFGPKATALPSTGDVSLTDIFTEVEEDLRRERAKRLWDRYGWLVTALLLVAVAGTGGYQGWRWYEAREAAQASTRYLAALRAAEEQRADVALEGFAGLTRASPAGYRLLARLQEAAIRAREGQVETAISLWEQLARDSTVPEPYRDLAVLLAVMHQIDSGEPAALAERLSPLDRPDGTFRFSARELQALLAERQQDRTRAVTILRNLADAADAPMALRNRAVEALTSLGTDRASGG